MADGMAALVHYGPVLGGASNLHGITLLKCLRYSVF